MLEHARAQIFIFDHARARSMLDFFILDATLYKSMVNKRSEKNLIFKRKEFEQIGIFPWSWLLFRFASNLSGVQKMESRFDQVEKLHIIQHWVGKLIKDMNTTIPTLLMKGTCHTMLECIWNVQCFKSSHFLFWFQTESISKLLPICNTLLSESVM